MCTSKAEEKWIGLAEVVPKSRNSELDKSAFVNVIGLASSHDSFSDLVRRECERIGVELVDLEDVEPWRTRIQNYQPDEEVVSLAASVSPDYPFLFHTFYTFDE